jgi:hypothetical protein
MTTLDSDPEQIREVTIWTIYYGSVEAPGKFIIRRWTVPRPEHSNHPSQPVPHEAWVCATLESARAKLPPGCVGMGRAPDDDPTVIESWI